MFIINKYIIKCLLLIFNKTLFIKDIIKLINIRYI